MNFVINRADDGKPNTGGRSRRLITKPNAVKNLHDKASHQHFCYVAGHRYECREDCECICGLPMNGYDHTDCPVELRACPEHENQPIAEERPLPEGVVEIKFPADWRREAQPDCECGCSEVDAAEVVGWYFHCTHVYATYSPEIQDRHLAYDCPGAPSEHKQAVLEALAKRAKKRVWTDI